MTRLVALSLKNKGYISCKCMFPPTLTYTYTTYTNKVALGIFDPCDIQASKVAHWPLAFRQIAPPT